MLIRSSILPDEIDKGYLGRLTQINGISNQTKLLRLARSWAGVANKSKKDFPPVILLSEVSGIDLPKFVCQHTTLPIRRCITPHYPDLNHGGKHNISILVGNTMRNYRQYAYLCKKCVIEDLKKFGTSYWHRNHQIPGIAWCPKHLTPLSYTKSDTPFKFDKPFLTFPSSIVGSVTTFDRKWIKEIQRSELIQRFINISLALIKREKPLNSQAVAQALLQQATKKNLIYSGFNNTPLLSDVVIDSFDQHWIEMAFPAIRGKIRGTKFYPLDNQIFSGKVGIKSIVYILAAAVLYDSAEQALYALNTARIIDINLPPNAKHTHNHSDNSKQRNTDIPNSIDLQKLAELVSNRISLLDLISLSNSNEKIRLFIFNFFIKRRSLATSMIISGIDQQTMEKTLRSTGKLFAQVMIESSKMSGKGNK